MADERGAQRSSRKRVALRRVMRSLAVIMVTVGVNGVLSGAFPRYEPVYLSLAAVAVIAWFEGAISGLFSALVIAAAYELLFSPLHRLSGQRMALPLIVALLVAAMTAVARRLQARPLAARSTSSLPPATATAVGSPAVLAPPFDRPESRSEPLSTTRIEPDELEPLRSELIRLQAELAASRSENERLTQASRAFERDAKTQMAQERARGAARDDEHARHASDLGQAVATIQRLRDEAAASQQELASIHEQQQSDGNALAAALAEVAASRSSAEQLRTSERNALSQLESSQKRIRDLTEELGAAAKRTAAAIDRAEAETAARTRKEQEFVAHEKRIHEQYESETEHLQTAAASALEQIQGLRSTNDELRRTLAEERERHGATGRELEALRSAMPSPPDPAEREALRAAMAALETKAAGLESSRATVLAELRQTRAIEEELRAEVERLRRSSAEAAEQSMSAHQRGEELAASLAREIALRKDADEHLAEAQVSGALSAEMLERSQQELTSLRQDHQAQMEALLASAARELALRQEAEQALAQTMGLADSSSQELAALKAASEASARGLAATRDAALADLSRSRAALEEAERSLDEARQSAAADRESVDREWGAKLQTTIDHLTSGHQREVGDLMTARQEARAEARESQARLQELEREHGQQRGALEERVAAHEHALAAGQQRLLEANEARETLDREWGARLQKIVNDLAGDHENDVGELMMAREESRAETRLAHLRIEQMEQMHAEGRVTLEETVAALQQSLAAEQQRVAEAIASREALDREWGEKLQRIVANLASDHEGDVGEAVMARESARAEVRGLEKRVQLLQSTLDQSRASTPPIDESSIRLQEELAAERRRADEEHAARLRVEAEWSEKLQTIVSHLAGDHESDMGQAIMEKEAAKAEARTLGMRVNALQQKLEADRGALDKAMEKWNNVRQALQTRVAQAEEEVASLRQKGRGKGEAEAGEVVFPPPVVDAHRARAEVLEVAEQAQQAFRRATSSGNVPVPAVARRPLVLIVDQDPAVRGSARESLMANGFDVLTASDGLEGLRIAVSHKPEIVVAETAMPKMGGRELCQMIKSNEGTAGVKVILLSQTPMPEGTDPIPPQLAADTTLQKPVAFDRLQNALMALLPG